MASAELECYVSTMLRPIEVEALAYKEIERMRQGAQPEDSIVELKLTLPEARDAAKQIGALCNAVQGDDAIWVVGVGEDGSFTAPSGELANWGPAMEKCFDEVYPTMQNYNVSFEGHPLTLLHFGTQQRPYVVDKGDGTKLVPWRRSNKTRTALRRDLLSLLNPGPQRPLLHIVAAHVTRERPVGIFNVDMTVYVIPKEGSRVILPFYRCSAYLQFGEQILWLPNNSLSWSMLGTLPEAQPLQFIFREPSFFSVRARYHQHGIQDPLPELLKLVLRLGYADMEGGAIAIDLPQTNIVREVQHFEAREAGWVSR